ncbi:RHS repeat-associated core domain-containing protein [Luteibacter sp. SG786]|uniref:RHS repeat-associated core domain-containing protein n=1 Tax=Luteibacter sp. SG786 TaxID=2587130 RepID=UPI001423906B|nr:RHS repeat-associated core domain-containing protein [Luteibacter sp. SG786]NII54902.1 RHS repeat-associated protein [Luteibacter sp. SG786]
MPVCTTPHTGTPVVAAIDPRGLPLRSVTYLRSEEPDPLQTLVHRLSHDAAGRERARWDPRLWAGANDGGPATLRQIPSLSGRTLRSDSADAGQRMLLLAASGRTDTVWDARGNNQWREGDALDRPLAIHERSADGTTHCVERFTYAPGSGDAHETNRAGRLVRHDDPVGSLHIDAFALTGGDASQRRIFLRSTAATDWPLEAAERDALLEDQPAITRFLYDATGDACAITDAAGHRWRFAQNIEGHPRDAWLMRPATGERHVFGEGRYDAAGRLVSRVAADQTFTTEWTYGEDDQRLKTRRSKRAIDGALLEDTAYVHDPVGNVLEIRRLGGSDLYTYDSLYRLTSTEGTESALATSGPDLPPWQPWPSSDTIRYTEHYTYDTAGNLVLLVHRGAWTGEQRMRVAPFSNRAVPWSDNDTDVDAAFDANGHQCVMPGVRLHWNVRGQLREAVRDVPNDREQYAYDGAGRRTRKWCVDTQGAITHETRYLPGLEQHMGADPHQVATVTIGDVLVRNLHWLGEPPGGLLNDTLRFQLSDHLGSYTCELDEQAEVIGDEWYRPYGDTAARVTRDPNEADYKTCRYSGKERDGTGLDYYGYRYYASSLQRWTSPDPAGYMDGWNLYAMVKGNPVTFADAMGLWSRQDTGIVAASAARAGAAEFISTVVGTTFQWAWDQADSDVMENAAYYMFLSTAVGSGAVVAAALMHGHVAEHPRGPRTIAMGAATLAGALGTGMLYRASGITGRQAVDTMTKLIVTSALAPVLQYGPRNDWAPGHSPSFTYSVEQISAGAAIAAGMARLKTYVSPTIGALLIPPAEKAMSETAAALLRMTRYRQATQTKHGHTFQKRTAVHIATGITTRGVFRPLAAFAETLWPRLGMNEEISASMSVVASSIAGYARGIVAYHVKKNLEKMLGFAGAPASASPEYGSLLRGRTKSLPSYGATSDRGSRRHPRAMTV